MTWPPPAEIRDLRSNLDQTLDEPFHSAFDFFAHEVELPEHDQDIISQNPHKQPGQVGCESMATRLVPAKRVLTLFDPILNIAPSPR
jgi:hypothetical protein